MKLVFSEAAWEDYLYWQATDAKLLARLDGLIKECARTPLARTGKPEPLRGALSGWWSWRLTQEHRVVYRVFEGALHIAQCRLSLWVRHCVFLVGIPMPEIWFYQLQRRTLDQVLPNLIERTLQRGWRSVVQATTPERLAALDALLWTYADDSFLPHGTAADGDPQWHTVWLTLEDDNPNGAKIRFLVEGAAAAPFAEADYERLILLFDGRDEAALTEARAQWKTLRARDVKLSYWAETEEGGWRQQA